MSGFHLVGLSVIVVLVLWIVPKLQVRALRKVAEAKDVFANENAARDTLAKMIAGFLVVGTIFVTLRQIGVTQETQITDRYIRAIELLRTRTDKGIKTPIESRLGAIYALERIALDSSRDHWTVMEVLSAYIRENSKATTPKAGVVEPGPKELNDLCADVQACITIIGRRNVAQDLPGRLLDLSKVDLRLAQVQNANLSNISFDGSRLDYANLNGADLKGSTFLRTIATGASLDRATAWRDQFTKQQLDSMEPPPNLIEREK
jgi:hypothetical protein